MPCSPPPPAEKGSPQKSTHGRDTALPPQPLTPTPTQDHRVPCVPPRGGGVSQVTGTPPARPALSRLLSGGWGRRETELLQPESRHLLPPPGGSAGTGAQPPSSPSTPAWERGCRAATRPGGSRPVPAHPRGEASRCLPGG